MKTKPKVAVLCGGISPERDVSLTSGQNVAEALSKNFDTELFKLPKNEIPTNLDPREFIVYPALHGDWGENGMLQAQLDEAGFSYAGCDSLSSRVCMVKPSAKSLLKFANVPVARALEFEADNLPSAETLANLFPNGAAIKPADKGSSVGLSVAHNLEDFKHTLSSIKEGYWMAEEFYVGDELSVGVLYGKAAGIVKITPEGGVYDFKRKYTAGSTNYEFPAKIPAEAERAIKVAAESSFAVCGCRDFARVDFILSDAQKPEFIALELNTLPGMTPTSLLPKSASCIGFDFVSLCAHLLEGAIKRFSEKKNQ